jgi:Fe-S oxidoreductase
MIPYRQAYWNIPGHGVLYPLFLPFAAFFLYGCWRLIRMVGLGQHGAKLPVLGHQIRDVLAQVFLQRRLLREPVGGSLHVALSWGFGVLFLATCLVGVQDYFGIPTLRGKFYLYFMSLTVDLFGIAATLAVIGALIRRYLACPERLRKPREQEGYVPLLWLLLAILMSGFAVGGLRIIATQDPWGAWSPGGWFAAQGLSTFSHPVIWHRIIWWGHAVLAFAFIGLLPFTLARHILFAPVNIVLNRDVPSGVLESSSLEEAENFGISTIEGFERKDLLDLIACTECGRCQDACPAWNTGKPLTPKGVVMNLRDHLMAHSSGADGKAMVGEVVSEDAIWACVTCGGCHQACPVFIKPIPKLINIRRYLVMEEARFPEPMQAALRGIENRGHPYQGVVPSRTEWAKGLNVKLMADGPAPLLYWVGCAAAFDARAQKVARAFARILQAAGIEFAILGDKERCTGDLARRIGHKFLFQMQAQANIETLNRYGVTQIVTTCPHCFNSLKHEYPQFGGRYEVRHHTELIARLLGDGRLQLRRSVAGRAAYHDSCYLGRHNGIYDAQRKILSAIPGLQTTEFVRHRDNGFCCGAGGGLMWFEERTGKRINNERTEEALRCGLQLVGTACPFCLSMFEDGVRATDAAGRLRAMDLAELVEIAM